MSARKKDGGDGAETLEEGASGARENGRLKYYRESLKRLQGLSGDAQRLSERGVELESRLVELRLEAAGLLDSDELEKELALNTTIRVMEAKLAHAREKVAQAESELNGETQSVRSQFNALFQVYRLWCISGEKAKLLALMDGACPDLALDAVVIHLKAVSDLMGLEMPWDGDLANLILRAEKLLARVGSEPEFVMPEGSVALAEGGVVAAAAVEGVPWPWDSGGGSLQAAIQELLREEPNLNLPTLYERLRSRRPEFFKSAKEVADLNKALPSLATGVYEQQKSGELVESK
jgi:hypothetical protein